MWDVDDEIGCVGLPLPSDPRGMKEGKIRSTRAASSQPIKSGLLIALTSRGRLTAEEAINLLIRK